MKLMPTIDTQMYEIAYARAVAFVRRRMQGQSWAASDLPEEIAGEAMAASFDPKRYPWRGDKAFDHHVINVVRSLLSDRARAAKVRADPKAKAAADEALKRSALPADGQVRERERAARQDARDAYMLANLTGTARQVYILYKDGVFDVERQAVILGKAKSAIYEARKRVVEVARAMAAEPESSPELASPDGDDPDSQRGEDLDGGGKAAS
jgi:hypothetical protein